VYNGDAVNKLDEVFEEEARKESTKINKEEKQTERQEANPFESEQSVEEPKQTKWERTAEKRETQQKKSREKYESRK